MLLVAALLGLALIGGGCFAIRALEEAAPGPGDCIAFRAPHDKTNIDQRPVPYKIDCGSPEAEYKMLSSSRTNHSCAPGNRMYQWRKVKNGQLGEPTQTWCLQPLPGGPNRAPAR
ncbi:hypothetical protein GOARA_043_01010 [Gordonia araii NBRC 100433]|uniref:Uncharacterized protein n=1 Tax=Gordonia araii NBRC 100433 TaxID=1073574 RepID=G7H164_9ACTN|nr:hypothetical protein GOARA_043_01010 [Gordonia araii NBRC 100433]